jgi:hypothetical protein
MEAIEGNSVVSGVVNASYNLILTKFNGNTINAGYVRGATGATGAQGVSVVSAAVNGAYELVLTLSNSTTVNAGNVRGPQGAQGVKGDTGATGAGTPAVGASATYIRSNGTSWVAASLGAADLTGTINVARRWSGAPIAMDAGAISAVTNPTGTVVFQGVTFVAGRFTTEPNVVACIMLTNPNNGIVSVAGISATGFTLYAMRTVSTGNLPIQWMAVQV